MKCFEDKVCIGIGRGFKLPINVRILKDFSDITFLRQYAAYELELPWFTIIIVDNF